MGRSSEASPQTAESRASVAPRLRWLSVLAALLALAHGASFLGAGPIDDDFIVHRYARNWIEGQGIVFQEGLRVEGYTVPLYLMVSAAQQLLGLDPVRGGLVLGLAAAAVAAWAVGRAWMEADPRRRWPLPGLLLALAPTFAWHGVAGLGTTLLAGLLALWFLELRRARAGRAACWLALACLLRQEAVLFLPAFWLHTGPRPPAVFLPLATALGWTLFRLAYYGTLLPVTYVVKKLPVVVDLTYGLEYLARATLQSGVGLLLVFAVLAALRERPGAEARRGGGRTAIAATPLRVLASGVSLHVAYVVWVGGDFVAWGRFFMPTLPLLLLGACEGLDRAPRALRTAVVTLLALGPAYLQLDWTDDGRTQRRGAHRFFEERWAELGRAFRVAVPPDTRVGISPVGAFGWTSRLPLVDLLGLTHDALLERAPDLETHAKGHHRSDAEWALAQRPEVFVLGNGVLQPDGELAINPWERELFQHPRFQAEYEAALVPVPGSDPLPCFLRRGWPRPAGWGR